MKINLNFEMKDLDGNPTEGNNLSKLLAKQLVGTSEGDILKHYEWAIALNKGDIIDIDTSDQEYLKKFIKANQFMTILAKHQILQAFDKNAK